MAAASAGRKLELTHPAALLDRIYYGAIAAPIVFYLGLNLLTQGFSGIWQDLVSGNDLLLVLLLVVLLVAHELLHVLGFVMAGVSLGKLKLSFLRESLSFELACGDAITIRMWQLTLLMPFLVLTPMLAVVAVYSEPPHPYWILLAISTSGCAFDIAVFAGLLGLPGKVRVRPELHNEDGRVYVYERSL